MRWSIALAGLLAFGCDNNSDADSGVGVDDGGGGVDAGGGGVDAGGGGVDGGPPAESCSDGVMNQDETDTDCGGTCGATCTPGEMCGGASDCTTDLCTGGTCDPLPSCTDTMMNGMETDVDCGGMMCTPCATGAMCAMDSDCMSAFCTSSACADPVCGNMVVEGAEDCDDGDGTTPAESATCDIDCTAVMCGDGVVNMMAGEACDGDGAGVGGETATCDTDCTAVMCGDGVVNAAAGEQCDDGNTVDDDLCSNTCQVNRASVMLTADATFDTDTGELNGAAASWNAATHTWLVTDLSVAAGVTLTVTGSNPLRVFATGDITLTGTVDGAGAAGDDSAGCDAPGAAGGVGGPGGGDGGNGGAFGLVMIDGESGVGSGAGLAGIGDDAGGGGGGHIARGGDGVADGTGTAGTGGSIYIAAVTAEGGSGGGGGSADDDSPAGIDTGDDGGGGGGGGGGGLYFDAEGSLTVTGTIDASGGTGGSSTCSSGSGGGGSGGTIILYATAAVTTAGATLNVSGGAGQTSGSNSGAGSDGEIFQGMRPTCSDGITNQDETDVDCGGTCGGTCGTALACRGDADCMSSTCLNNACYLATCTNRSMDGAETGVDCGGADCPACSCTDGLWNGAETDIDCGGGTCGACADGEMCAASSDCASACDTTTSTCVSCVDGVMNQDETDVDCGGATCHACSAGEACAAGTDCASGTCTALVCSGFFDDFEAGTMLGAAWATSGDAVWFGSTTSPIAGAFSAECGDIGNNELSDLDLAVTCGSSASVTFTYTTSTEDGYDFLEFLIDGTRSDRFSGENSATTVTFPLSAGMHTLRWRYDKDGSLSSGSDTVWIDDVRVNDCTAP